MDRQTVSCVDLDQHAQQPAREPPRVDIPLHNTDFEGGASIDRTTAEEIQRYRSMPGLAEDRELRGFLTYYETIAQVRGGNSSVIGVHMPVFRYAENVYRGELEDGETEAEAQIAYFNSIIIATRGWLERLP